MRAVPLLLVTVLMLVGCGKSSPLVGTWSSPSTLPNGEGETVVTFNSDGKFDTKSVYRTTGGVTLTATDTGTWLLEGNQLRMTYVDIDWTFEGPNQTMIERARAAFLASKAQLLAESNKTGESAITWAGEDTFTMAHAGKQYTYTRKK